MDGECPLCLNRIGRPIPHTCWCVHCHPLAVAALQARLNVPVDWELAAKSTTRLATCTLIPVEEAPPREVRPRRVKLVAGGQLAGAA